MRVTRSQLRRIIKEEFRRVLREEPVRMHDMEIRAGDKTGGYGVGVDQPGEFEFAEAVQAAEQELIDNWGHVPGIQTYVDKLGSLYDSILDNTVELADAQNLLDYEVDQWARSPENSEWLSAVAMVLPTAM